MKKFVLPVALSFALFTAPAQAFNLTCPVKKFLWLVTDVAGGQIFGGWFGLMHWFELHSGPCDVDQDSDDEDSDMSNG